MNDTIKLKDQDPTALLQLSVYFTTEIADATHALINATDKQRKENFEEYLEETYECIKNVYSSLAQYCDKAGVDINGQFGLTIK